MFIFVIILLAGLNCSSASLLNLKKVPSLRRPRSYYDISASFLHSGRILIYVKGCDISNVVQLVWISYFWKVCKRPSFLSWQMLEIYKSSAGQTFLAMQTEEKHIFARRSHWYIWELFLFNMLAQCCSSKHSWTNVSPFFLPACWPVRCAAMESV